MARTAPPVLLFSDARARRPCHGRTEHPALCSLRASVVNPEFSGLKNVPARPTSIRRLAPFDTVLAIESFGGGAFVFLPGLP